MKAADISQLKVLVVDDESIVVSLVRDALEDLFPHIYTTYSAPEALDLIIQHDIDLVITDVRMPVMTGIELVSRAREVNPSIGAIFMTGYADLNSAKEAIKQGALDYIQKPFELVDIRQTANSAAQKLVQQAADKQSGKHLERLSDLNQMIYATGDRKSLMLASLRFVILHCASDRGCVLFSDKENSELTLLNLCGDTMEETSFNVPSPSIFLDSLMPPNRANAVLLASINEHQAVMSQEHTGVGKALVSLFGTWKGAIATLAIHRGETVHGYMVVGLPETTMTVTEGNLKFLSITLSQLALSLENLSLLEKTQAAYSRLKELQDVSIHLEKLAARGEMAAEIAHELNNFIAVVSGKAELLEMQIKHGNLNTIDNHISAIKENIEKVRRFTSDLMDYRSTETRREVVSFERILSEVVDYLRPQKRFSDIDIRTSFRIDPNFEGDTTQIQQLLYNLFNNAADAMLDCSSKQISVVLEEGSTKNHFRVAITDTGAGIDPEFLKKAFKERFTTKEHGHGYGLIVCGRIIENHGGVLNIESQPNKGTTIGIDFPVAHTHDAVLVY